MIRARRAETSRSLPRDRGRGRSRSPGAFHTFPAIPRPCCCVIALLAVFTATASIADQPSQRQKSALEARDYQIRVKLSELAGESVCSARGEDGLSFQNPDGAESLATRDGVAVALRRAPVKSARTFHRIFLKAFALNERRRAEQFAALAARELGVPAEILEEPFRKPWSLEPRSPDAALCVTVGKFPSEALARQALSMLPASWGAEILEDRSRPFPGFIGVYDDLGNPMGVMVAGGSIRSRSSKGTVAIKSGVSRASVSGWKAAPRFRGFIQLFPEGGQGILPVNAVHLEQYLMSVVPAEIGAFAPREALKAQAVAARSEAIHKLAAGSRHGDERYDFVSTQQDQAYPGAGSESEDATKYVRATQGEVLLHEGQVIDAVYSHSCGGITANSEDLWLGLPAPYLRSKYDNLDHGEAPSLKDETDLWRWMHSPADSYCRSDQGGFPEYAKAFFRWSRLVAGSSISATLADRGFDVGSLKALRIDRRTSSGRAQVIEATGSDGFARISNGDTIRAMLGGLPSSFFTMDIKKNGDYIESIEFDGAGFGHGVGLCQVGAYMMARRGFGYRKILQHYFSDVTLTKLY